MCLEAIVLIEFRVKNFRSLRDEQVLSLVASNDKTLFDSHTMTTGVTAVPALLRSAVVYGANASGKSNLIKALQFMRSIVLESATLVQPNQMFNVQPFRLDNNSTNQATEFEISFMIQGVRYQYGFTLTNRRIMTEYLLVYKAFKPQRWFDRYVDTETGKEVYEFGTGLKGSKSVWEGATRPNSLFLSMAVQLNSEQLRPIFEWFQHHLVIINELTPLAPHLSVQMLKNDIQRKAICDFLTAADISIADIDVVTQKKTGQVLKFDIAVGQTEVRTEEIEETQLRFHHKTQDAKAVFELADESNGTRNLLFLAGPILEILNQGLTLIIDELDTSLHTLLVRELIRLFHHSGHDVKGAQLIFTTHDTSLLDAPDLFRRDQIWLVEKDREQASSLVSLSEFSPRKNEALERGYLTGRYGGVPFLANHLGVKH